MVSKKDNPESNLDDSVSKILNIISKIAANPSEIIGRTYISNITVSTANTSDLGLETAIIDVKGTHPVERYSTLEEAKSGHNKWMAAISSGLKTITKLGYPGLLEPEVIELVY